MEHPAAARVIEALRCVIADQGRLVIVHPARLRAGLSDVLGGETTHAEPYLDALTGVAQSSIGQRLLDPRVDPSGVVAQLIADDPDRDRVAVRWAVDALAAALNRREVSPTEFTGRSSITHVVSSASAQPRTRLGELAPESLATERGPTPPTPATGERRSAPDHPHTAGAAPTGSGTTSRSRSASRPLIAAGVLLAVAATSVGITYGVASPSPTVGAAALDGARHPLSSGQSGTATTTVGTTVVTTTTTTVDQVTTARVVVTRAVVEQRPPSSSPEQAAVATICTPAKAAMKEATAAINAWATSDSGSAAAKSATQVLSRASNTLMALSARAKRTSAVSLVAWELAERYRTLADATRTAITGQYSSDAWNEGMTAQTLARDGFNEICAEAEDGLAYTAAPEAVRASCKRILPVVAAGDQALKKWDANPNTSTARDVTTAMDRISDVEATVRWTDRILYTTPLRQWTSHVSHWAFNLGDEAGSAPGNRPPDTWLTGWTAARQQLLTVCGP